MKQTRSTPVGQNAETRLCNYKHPKVRDIISKIITPDMSDTEKARVIFYYVRDNVKYALGGAGFFTQASKVFDIGYGDCGSKTNAHMALLRAANIPVRMHAAMADASILVHFMPKWLYTAATKKSCKDYHFWPECYLNGRWIACDALLDQKLYEQCLAKNLLTNALIATIEWDGSSDCMPLQPWLLDDLGTKESWDEWLETYLKFIMPGTPKAAVKLFEFLIAPICRRTTDKIRVE